ncbi:MAG: LacI family transcriptional regulator [Lachnospiraceae bacterium]|nr:LacI family transcriptional regulator [Lachnospiraceae bacterium]
MATISDVANMAGVSIATVSRAFSEPDMVSPSTRKRIHDAADTLKYRPNAIARAMVTKRTGNLAFIIYSKQAPAIMNPFYGAVLESVVSAATKEGYGMFIATDTELNTAAGKLMLQKQVDGIIFSSKPDYEILSSAKANNTPVVLINHEPDMPKTHCLLSDDYGGIRIAVRHLAELGHEKIGFVSGTFTDFIRTRRYHGFLQALGELGLRFVPEWFIECEPAIEVATKAVIKILSLIDRPTALVCANDTLAVGAVKGAQRLGFSVPEDISVTGFDDSVLCTVCEPELTSIRIDKDKMGKLAVECLMSQISGVTQTNYVRTLTATLALRSSSAKVRNLNGGSHE